MVGAFLGVAVLAALAIVDPREKYKDDWGLALLLIVLFAGAGHGIGAVVDALAAFIRGLL